MEWIDLAQDRGKWRDVWKKGMNIRVLQSVEYLLTS